MSFMMSVAAQAGRRTRPPRVMSLKNVYAFLRKIALRKAWFPGGPRGLRPQAAAYGGQRVARGVWCVDTYFADATLGQPPPGGGEGQFAVLDPFGGDQAVRKALDGVARAF